jgi:hypothetical protein
VIEFGWGDAQYAKLFKTMPEEWKLLGYHEKALYHMLWQACDRAGVLYLGRLGRRVLASTLGVTWEEIEEPLAQLEGDGWLEVDEQGGRLFFPHYLPAHEAKATPAARAKRHRELQRAVTPRDAPAPRRSTARSQRDERATAPHGDADRSQGRAPVTPRDERGAPGDALPTSRSTRSDLTTGGDQGDEAAGWWSIDGRRFGALWDAETAAYMPDAAGLKAFRLKLEGCLRSSAGGEEGDPDMVEGFARNACRALRALVNAWTKKGLSASCTGWVGADNLDLVLRLMRGEVDAETLAQRENPRARAGGGGVQRGAVPVRPRGVG